VKEFLRVWKYSLGSFSDSKTERYDNWIALIRTVIFVSYMVTNCFICAGVVRHWDASRPASLRDWNSIDSVTTDTEYIKK